MEIIDARDGFAVLRVSGKKVLACFRGEAGGHRWQRVPPTEKRGRVHTSTISVVVLPEPSERELRIDPADLDESFTRGSGAGGQHRNKTDTAVILVHRPTGIRVRIDGGRSQHHNRVTALAVLRAKLAAAREAERRAKRNAARKEQAGSGMRGDKIRTIRVRHDEVVDHRTGRRTTYKRYARGFLADLRG